MNMNLELLIIADDLTGAADTAVQFSKQGIRSALFLATDVDFDSVDAAIKVVAVDTESRHCPQHEAYKKVESAVKKARLCGCRRFYKKIDSTFRGNTGAELEALMSAAGAPRLALVPAYPAGGRTTRKGYQHVKGKPLHESAFARDPREPVSESFIPAILGRQTSLTIHMIDRTSVRAGSALAKRQRGIFLFDAETDDDLAAIADNLDKCGDLDVVAGAAGFAETLASLYRKKTSDKSSLRPKFRYPERLLVVNGSLNDVSLGQVEQAQQEGTAGFFVTPTAARRDAASEQLLADAVVQRLNNDRCAIVTTGAGLQGTIAPALYAEHIGRIVSAVVAQVPVVNVAVFGGDTAAAVCRRLGYHVLYPCDEILPGLTVCSKDDASVVLILKSGGFGPRDVISKIRGYLKIRG
jgi:uncharacterized protein YgbK (DUF1537 family)